MQTPDGKVYEFSQFDVKQIANLLGKKDEEVEANGEEVTTACGVKFFRGGATVPKAKAPDLNRHERRKLVAQQRKGR